MSYSKSKEIDPKLLKEMHNAKDSRSLASIFATSAVMDAVMEDIKDGKIPEFLEKDSNFQYYGGEIVPSITELLSLAVGNPNVTVNREGLENATLEQRHEVHKFLKGSPAINKIKTENKEVGDKAYPINDPTIVQFHDGDKVSSESRANTESLLSQLSMEDVNKVEDLETLKNRKQKSIIPI